MAVFNPISDGGYQQKTDRPVIDYKRHNIGLGNSTTYSTILNITGASGRLNMVRNIATVASHFAVVKITVDGELLTTSSAGRFFLQIKDAANSTDYAVHPNCVTETMGATDKPVRGPIFFETSLKIEAASYSGVAGYNPFIEFEYEVYGA